MSISNWASSPWKEETTHVLRKVCWNRLCFFNIIMGIKWNNYSLTTEGVLVKCLRRKMVTQTYCNSYRLWACHHVCFWCGCWLRSSCSLSGHLGWSLQEWQAGGPGESGQWESYVCPVGTYGHRWSGFLKHNTYQVTVIVLYPGKHLMPVLSNEPWVKGLVIIKMTQIKTLSKGTNILK